MCLILKEHLVDESILEKFINNEHHFYVNTLLNLFNDCQNLNQQWMITEIFKQITFNNNKQHSNTILQKLITNQNFVKFLFTNVFRNETLEKLKTCQVIPLEWAILVNILETIENLCECNNADYFNYLINGDDNIIKWLTHSLILSSNNLKEFKLAIIHLLYKLSQIKNCQPLNDTLVDHFIKQDDFFMKSMEHFASEDGNESSIESNFNSIILLDIKLYLIGTFVNLIDKSNHDLLLKLLHNSQVFIINAFNIRMNDSFKMITPKEDNTIEIQNDSNNNTYKPKLTENAESKLILKSIEQTVDSKLISIEILKNIIDSLSPGITKTKK
jgi:hypothetical protein